MWAIDPGSALREASDDDEPEEEDRRSSASFLRSLGGDDVDDLLNPKPEGPELSKSLLSATTPARPKPKDASQTARYFQQEAERPATSRSSSDRPRVCFLCGGADHNASRCPGEVCFMCLEAGHTSRDCPSGGASHLFLERVRSITYRTAAAAARGGGGAARPDLSQVRCLACGALGHVDCTPDEGWPKNLSCFNCGRDGHSALGCPAEGMDRWHKRFAPLASSTARWQGRASGGGGGSSKPGPPPAAFRQRGGGSGGGASSSKRDGPRRVPSSSSKPGPPPARFADRSGGGGSGGGRSGGRGGGRGGFSQPKGIVKPRPSNHIRFS